MKRLAWLLGYGVSCIHFCGGEPTIHPALPSLLLYVKANGGSTKLTTNGIAISDALLEAVSETHTEVKVSLHGDREQHNRVTGCDAFDRTTTNLQRLVRSGVSTSIQTTVVKDAEWVVSWVASFCLKARVRRLSVLPFIPRGDGSTHRETYELTEMQRRDLQKQVSTLRRTLSARLDVRWLDFTAQRVPVVEADGRVVLEGATETMDRVLFQIP